MKASEVACGVPALEPIRVTDTMTGVELAPMDVEALFWNHLDRARHCQNMMIRLNTGLSAKGEGFGNEWARKNVCLVSLPALFRNLSHQNRVNQCETARLVLAWQARERVATALDKLGWDKATCKDVSDLLGRQVDPQLFANVVNHGGHPIIPTVVHTRFPYDQSNNNSCRQGEIDFDRETVTYRRMAVADRFVDVTLVFPNMRRRYPDMIRVSRPTMRRTNDGRIVFDLVVFERRPVKPDVSKTPHVVGFDFNADWHGGISGVRLAYNGHVSRELIVGVDTQRQQIVLERLYVEYQRCLTALKNLMPWQRPSDPDDPIQVAAYPKWERLYSQSITLRDKMYRIKELLDWRYAHDIISHAKPGELIAVEKLDAFDASGRYEFRHGSQLAKLDHVANRNGRRVVQVNPAHTSDTCPWCHTRVKNLGRKREYQCPGCGRTIQRDYGSAVNIADRGRRYLGHKGNPITPPKGRPTRKRPKLTRTRHSGAVPHDQTSGTGKGPASFHATAQAGMATAIIRNTRKRTAATPLVPSRTATRLRQEP
ncbi:transposase [Bifidobacterium amazonense]|uniref:Transposase n=1 Tax=Bifidobacterium amazonense TaxID=2809027 RepID=A0ABS9VXW1_9BIFI|nr:transposase [Bifidobacterium amazonense]MCH9276799.1 transposase [Bifidobacterium amazonense]